MAALASETLLDTPLLQVRRVICRTPRSGCGPEEDGGPRRFVVPRRGHFQWHSGRRGLPLDPAMGLLTGHGTPSRVSHPLEGGDECVVLEVPVEGWSAAEVDPEGRETRAVRLSAASLLAVRGLTGRPGRDADLGAEETALLAFRQLVADAAPGPAPGSARLSGAARAALERVRALLAARPYDRIGLDAIGREVGRSPYQLAREFRSAFGTSIHQHRLRLRLAGAVDRLAEGETDLARLALETGFASHSHLTATVVRLFGASPSALRADLARGRPDGLRTILKAPLPLRA